MNVSLRLKPLSIGSKNLLIVKTLTTVTSFMSANLTTAG